MPAPEDKKWLQRLLGMTNYLSRYAENYSDKTSVLRELLHDDVLWHWKKRHDQAFQNLKDNLCKPPVLAYYDVHKPVTLTCDSSKSVLGAAILNVPSHMLHELWPTMVPNWKENGDYSIRVH